MGFKDYHPLTLFIYILLMLLVCMFVTHPIILLTALLGAVLFYVTLPYKGGSGGLWFYVILFFLITLTNPLFSHRGVTPLFFLNGNPITLEALAYGAGMGLSILAVLLWCRCFCVIMKSEQLLYLLGKPFPKLSLILSIALRFIPLFLRQMKKVSSAQKTLGLYSTDSYPNRLLSALRVFRVVLSWSAENAMETAMAMRARGYGLKGRGSFFMFRFTKRDFVMLVTMALLLGITLWGGCNGDLRFAYYPSISAISFNGSSIITNLAFGIFSFLPFFVQIGERAKWKYFISKI